MLMASKTLKIGLISYIMLLLMAVVTQRSDAQEPTPTEAIAACISNAWQVNSKCQTDGNWWNDIPCAIKFEADVILCTGAIF